MLACSLAEERRGQLVQRCKRGLIDTLSSVSRILKKSKRFRFRFRFRYCFAMQVLKNLGADALRDAIDKAELYQMQNLE